MPDQTQCEAGAGSGHSLCQHESPAQTPMSHRRQNSSKDMVTEQSLNRAKKKIISVVSSSQFPFLSAF